MPYLLYNKCTGKQMCSVCCPGFKITLTSTETDYENLKWKKVTDFFFSSQMKLGFHGN